MMPESWWLSKKLSYSSKKFLNNISWEQEMDGNQAADRYSTH
jgi:hypothetical protein